LSLREYVRKHIVEKIAIEKYRENGLGITFEDIERELSLNKAKAQRTLKYFHDIQVLFTANDLMMKGITVLKNTSPQQYFPTCVRAEIVEGLSKRENVLVNPTGVNHSSSPLSSLVPPLSNTNDQIILETLEGHILPLLPTAPSYIHNIHLKLSIIPQCYVELGSPTIPGNKGKKTTEVLGRSKVDYTFYPNGTVNVEVMCSNRPFRLQTEEDRSHLLVFFGQIEQVLISILSASHGRIVPNVLEWEVTECDINKDVKVSDWFHYTGLRIQVKHMDRLFSLYIKKMGKDTVYRVEERKHPHKPALDFINDIFNPMEKVEKQIATLNTKISAVYDIISKLRMTTAVNHKTLPL
jgi:hypothetical protein